MPNSCKLRTIIWLQLFLLCTPAVSAAEEQSRSLNNQGTDAVSQQNYVEAERCFKSAYAIAKRDGNRKRMCTVLNNLSVLYGLQGRTADVTAANQEFAKLKNDQFAQPYGMSKNSSADKQLGNMPLNSSTTESLLGTSKNTTRKASAKPPNSCSPSQLWALACPALLTVNNGHQHDILSGTEPTPETVAAEKELLSKYWGVESREDLFNSLSWIDNGGHRVGFDRLAKIVDDQAAIDQRRLRVIDQDKYKFDDQLQVVRSIAPQLAGKSLYGWDYCRYIALCRWGVLCNYLTASEAWELIMPVARNLQDRFSSWDELGQNYLLGRQYWGAEPSLQNSFEANYRYLLSDPNSPWRKIPWRTNLL
jgi:hypothetical protein